MKNAILTVSALTIAAAMSFGTTVQHAEAKPPSGNKGISTPKTTIHVSNTQVSKSSHYSFCRPRSYCGWSNYCWYPQYGCYSYYCADDSLWYYWCAQQYCYLPVSYIAVYRPTCIGIRPVLTTVQVTPTVALPVGATALPPATAALPGPAPGN
jgi:hypothetical protein